MMETKRQKRRAKKMAIMARVIKLAMNDY